MFNPTAALASWLAATLTGLSLAIWRGVLPLTGGPDAPLWRWVLVEQGLFVCWVFLAAWWTRMLLGLGNIRRTPQHYGAAAVFACGFSLVWTWYHLVAAYAISLGFHPAHGWEWTFFTWGLPLLLSAALLPAAPFLAKLGVALGLGAFAILVLGRVWAGLPGPRRNMLTSRAYGGRNARRVPRL